jgi:hypothetical protein
MLQVFYCASGYRYLISVGKERMSPKAELVKQISAFGFTEAIDLMACLAVLREGKSLVTPRALEAANAALAATIVQKALLQRVLMTVERAFAPVNKRKLDRHARVAFVHLSDPNIFDEVAKAYGTPQASADGLKVRVLAASPPAGRGGRRRRRQKRRRRYRAMCTLLTTIHQSSALALPTG